MHQETHADPRFERRVHFAVYAVHAEPRAVVQTEPVDRGPCVLDERRHLMSVQHLAADGGVCVGYRRRRFAAADEEIVLDRRLEMVVDIFQSGAHLVPRTGCVFQLRGDRYVVNHAVVAHPLVKRGSVCFHIGDGVQRLVEPAAVAAVMHACVEEQLVANPVLPVHCRQGVAPRIAHSHLVLPVAAVVLSAVAHLHVFDIRTIIDTYRQAVAVGERVAQFGVDVVEIIPCPHRHVFFPRSQNGCDDGGREEVEIGPSGGYVKRGLGAWRIARFQAVQLRFAEDRTLHVHFGGYQSYGYSSVPEGVVSLFLADVYHRAEARTETRREIALVECHVFDGVGIEDGEHAQCMVDVV